MERLAVSSGISVNGAAQPSRNSHHRCQSGKSTRDGEQDNLLQVRSGFCTNRSAFPDNFAAGIAKNCAAIALIRHDQIRATAQNNVGVPCPAKLFDKLSGIRSFKERICRTAQAKPCDFPKRSVFASQLPRIRSE